ncbi:MAG: hypothetical protein U0136_02490 [Bdellovibrionota bacterium]
MKEKTCQLTGKVFQISQHELDALKAFALPMPTLCPEERFRRALSFRPSKHFFLRECDATGASIFSVFTPAAPFPVYSVEYWQSAEWDPFSFGQPFDFKRLFVEQLLELWRKVPRPAAVFSNTTTSRVVHNVHDSVSCFLVFDSVRSEGCLYSDDLANCTECIDSHRLTECELCYETVVSSHCRELRFCEHCHGCSDSWFLSNCRDCTNCLFCVNLTGKQFHIFNQPVSEEQYRTTLSELGLAARPLLELARNRFADFIGTVQTPHVMMEDSAEVSGNYLLRSSQCVACFECEDCAQVFHGHNLRMAQNCFECVLCEGIEESAQSIGIVGGRHVLNSIDCRNVENIAYSTFCEDSADLFGCIALKNQQYCIFNRQFSKDDYAKLRDQIVRHMKDRNVWAAALSTNLSGHAYNYSAAGENMPLTKIPAKMMGFNWDDSDRALRPSDLLGDAEHEPEELYSDVPEHSEDVDLGKLGSTVYICSMSSKPFQLLPEEMALYRRLGLPPPAHCFEQRHLERLSRLTPHALSSRNCSVSGEEILTAVPTKWKQPVVSTGNWADGL